MTGSLSRPQPRVVAALLGITAHFGVIAAASAQFVTSGADLDAPAGEAIDETAYKGRLMASGTYYGESSNAAVDPLANTGDDPASDQALLYTDLRGRIEAAHIQGGKWDAAGDFRIRYADGADASRGWLGGSESDLREAFILRRGGKTDVSIGRLVVRDVDATTIDGLRVTHRRSPGFELGAFAGVYPNPFSRDVATDYPEGRALGDLPLGAGAWAGYRSPRAHGAIGAAVLLPRDPDDVDPEPTRAFLTANGYFRVRPGFDVYHYGVVDVAGRGGVQLLNGQLGVRWRKSPELLLEAAVSHLSTYAIELYVRDYLENPDAAPMPMRIQNNLFVARMASDEGRGGATYTLRQAKVDVFGQVRYRRRATIASDELPMEIAALPPDTQIDVSGGARKRDAFLKTTVTANLIYITGDWTSTWALTGRLSRGFRDDRVAAELDVSYLKYDDACPATGDPACMGTATGSSTEFGGNLVWRRDRHWMFLGDYHYSTNAATTEPVPGTTTDEPTITGHSLFVRGQYSF